MQRSARLAPSGRGTADGRGKQPMPQRRGSLAQRRDGDQRDEDHEGHLDGDGEQQGHREHQ